MPVTPKIKPMLWFDGQAEGVALNGGPKFKFTEAISLVIEVETQEEVDRYWKALTSNGGQEGFCGWLKDRYGLSWQVVPSAALRALSGPDQKKADRVMAAVMEMKKFDVGKVEAALRG